MIWRADTARPPAGDMAGFTLIEMLVVVAVLAFALVLVVGYKPPWSRSLDVEAVAAELASQLRLARSEALAQNQAIALQLDPGRHRYRTGAAAPVLLPATLSISLLTVAGEQRRAAVGNIRFNPDGSSTGGRIVIADGKRQVAVGVDWLTGRVSIADVR